MSYWGVKDTSINFCEEPYKENTYVAEFYNTLSGSLYILVALPFLNTKVSDIAIISIFLGIGTILLHMTQRNYGQLLDETMMLLLCYVILCKIRKEIYKKRYAIGIITFYLFNNKIFLVFFSLFMILILLIIYESRRINNEKNKYYRNLFLYSMSFGTLFWISDQIYCETVQIYQFHAFWHITTSVSIYCGLVLLDI
tara:strand:+ start:217 stop:807 length:591 start_codon:yes stop_codon:yes gene_type:complete